VLSFDVVLQLFHFGGLPVFHPCDVLIAVRSDCFDRLAAAPKGVFVGEDLPLQLLAIFPRKVDEWAQRFFHQGGFLVFSARTEI